MLLVKEIRDIHVYFPLRVWLALRRLAKRNRRSVSAEVVLAVEKRIQEEKNGKG